MEGPSYLPVPVNLPRGGSLLTGLLAIRRGNDVMTHPRGDTILKPGDMLVVMTSAENLGKVTALCTAPIQEQAPKE